MKMSREFILEARGLAQVEGCNVAMTLGMKVIDLQLRPQRRLLETQQRLWRWFHW